MNINDLIKKHVGIEDEVIDIGCGDKRRSSDLLCKKVTTLDAWDKVQPDILLDLEINDIPFLKQSFDVVLMIDFIEHLEKKRGYIILEQAKQISRKVVILLTPLWWQDNKENVNNKELWCYNNNYDHHKSLWSVDDFIDWNRITGIPGLENYFVGIYICKGENNV